MASNTIPATAITSNSGCEQDSKESTKEETHPFAEPWEDSDLVLLVEDEKFHVHRQILSIHSPVFKVMLGTKFKEAIAKEIPLPGKKANEVLDFLKQMYLKESDGVTLDKVEHVLKLADEYQTKSVFDVCANLLKNIMARSEEEAIRILFLANTTDMARQDVRLNITRIVCYDYIKNMALQKIMEKEDFKNLEQNVRENVLVKRIEKLEELVKKVHPKVNELADFCVTLCLESSKHSKKITRCPVHYNSEKRAAWPLLTCTVCENMIREFGSLSKSSTSSRSKQTGAFSMGSFGGSFSPQPDLLSVIQDLQHTHNHTAPTKSFPTYGTGGFKFSSGPMFKS